MTMHHLDGFEQRLLDTLQARIRDDRVETERGIAANRRARLRAGIAIGSLAAAAAIVVPLLAGRHGAAPAYAVTRSADGTVTATIYRFQDAAGLQRQLTRAGVTATVQYAPPGQRCERPRYTHLEDSLPDDTVVTAYAGGRHHDQTSVTVKPDALRGLTLVLSLAEGPGRPVTSAVRDYVASLPHGSTATVTPALISSLEVGVSAGPVEPCRLVPGR